MNTMINKTLKAGQCPYIPVSGGYVFISGLKNDRSFQNLYHG